MDEVRDKKLHVAIIMDGNGRWGKNRGRSRTLGHRRGAKAVQEAVKYALRIGMHILPCTPFQLKIGNVKGTRLR